MHQLHGLKVVLGVSFRKPRRRRLAILLLTELVLQWINVSFYLVPNINLLARPCAMFSNLVCESAILLNDVSPSLYRENRTPPT